MFRKPFKIKSNTQVKGSDRKKIRTEIGCNFPQLTEEDLLSLIPTKEYISTMKIVTHCGESVIVYLVEKTPLVFEINKIMYPTVYMLWSFPNLVHTFTTYPVVFSKLIGGADLMLPGVVMEEPYSIKSFGKLKKGDVVAVNLTDNSAPIALGTAALSSIDMYMSAKRGKGVHILHFHGDLLCANIKLTPPKLVPPSIIQLDENETGVKELNTSDTCKCLCVDDAIDGFSATVSQNVSCIPKDPMLECEATSENTESVAELCIGERENFSLKETESGNNVLDAEKELIVKEELNENNDSLLVELHYASDQETDNINYPVTSLENEVDVNSIQDSMDKLIEYCFLKALKTTARKLTLPLLTSNFFKVHMIPACPKGDILDLKKSSYKKLSKFLKEMEVRKVIEIRELTKGVESIVSVNFSNPMLKRFVEDSDDEDASFLDTPSGKVTEVNEMFVINASTLPLFKNFGYRKGDSLLATSIRHHLTEYVTQRGLQSTKDKRFVKLDHTLSSCLRLKEEEELTWKELILSCVEQMGNSYSLGQTGSVNKGKLKPIEITVATRTGNKKVTLINNLELYGINCVDFAKKCQHGVAASATVTQIPGTKSAQVMVQGNQVIFLEKLLTGEYQIQKRFLRGLENAPKLKKPKKSPK